MEVPVVLFKMQCKFCGSSCPTNLLLVLKMFRVRFKFLSILIVFLVLVNRHMWSCRHDSVCWNNIGDFVLGCLRRNKNRQFLHFYVIPISQISVNLFSYLLHVRGIKFRRVT